MPLNCNIEITSVIFFRIKRQTRTRGQKYGYNELSVR